MICVSLSVAWRSNILTGPTGLEARARGEGGVAAFVEALGSGRGGREEEEEEQGKGGGGRGRGVGEGGGGAARKEKNLALLTRKTALPVTIATVAGEIHFQKTTTVSWVRLHLDFISIDLQVVPRLRDHLDGV